MSRPKRDLTKPLTAKERRKLAHIKFKRGMKAKLRHRRRTGFGQ